MITELGTKVNPEKDKIEYNNKIVQDNIKKLKEYGYEFTDPIEGNLSCGYKAIGKLAKKETIISYVNKRIDGGRRDEI